MKNIFSQPKLKGDLDWFSWRGCCGIDGANFLVRKNKKWNNRRLHKRLMNYYSYMGNTGNRRHAAKWKNRYGKVLRMIDANPIKYKTMMIREDNIYKGRVERT